MARLPYLQKSDLAPENQDLLARDINLVKLLAYSPNATRAFSGLGMFIRNGSKLDPRLREMAILQVGYLARSEYEYTHHIEIGRAAGVSDDDIRAVAADTAGQPTSLDPLSHAVLRAAREMFGDLAISDATFRALAEDMDSECLLDLIVAIAFYCGVVRVLGSLQIDLEPGYQRYLDEFPFAPL